MIIHRALGVGSWILVLVGSGGKSCCELQIPGLSSLKEGPLNPFDIRCAQETLEL